MNLPQQFEGRQAFRRRLGPPICAIVLRRLGKRHHREGGLVHSRGLHQIAHDGAKNIREEPICQAGSYEPLPVTRDNLLVQFLDRIRTIAAADQRGVGRVDDNQIVTADRGNQVLWIAGGRQGSARIWFRASRGGDVPGTRQSDSNGCAAGSP